MPTRRCKICGAPFFREQEETWKTKCYACWKKTKDTSETAQLRARIKYLESRITTLEGDSSSPSIRPWVSKLLQLCHPDKHNNSKLATEATKWLLSQRKK